ncbi:Helix-turn-helix domain-containing protein [Muriicola jejuensis]|uniref:Helix-turn-helix domain-containing protein n=1 Tax=Muriicola jejuensis TaxID=504488 RepID=A0A6P0UDQ6_9FLAO|nr:helix-turn-helix domain-containing protein [Muriicola jejuensis]NER10049.1 helix-turn-helix domain-containing protein [Muriicola jejuensis]SMP03422.1 Helix-turn-helix domain-containing protein [Muriicola jejuensis]
MGHLKFEDLPRATEIILKKLSALEEELKKIKEHFQPKEPVELLTREETAEFLKISLTTLWQWSKKGVLPSNGIGNRVFYKRSEILNSILELTHRQRK